MCKTDGRARYFINKTNNIIFSTIDNPIEYFVENGVAHDCYTEVTEQIWEIIQIHKNSLCKDIVQYVQDRNA